MMLINVIASSATKFTQFFVQHSWAHLKPTIADFAVLNEVSILSGINNAVDLWPFTSEWSPAGRTTLIC